MRLAGVAFFSWIAFVCGSIAGSNAVFTDQFENGIVSISQDGREFWSTDLQYNSSVIESDGKVVITACRAGSNKATRAAITSLVDPRFDFFTAEGLIFRIKMTTGGSVGEGGKDEEVSSRVYLSNTVGKNLTSLSDYFMIQFLKNGTVSVRSRASSAPVRLLRIERNSLTEESVEVRLHLNRDRYVLEVGQGDIVYTYKGTHELSAVAWGRNGSAITFNSQLGGPAPEDASSIMSVEEVNIFPDNLLQVQ